MGLRMGEVESWLLETGSTDDQSTTNVDESMRHDKHMTRQQEAFTTNVSNVIHTRSMGRRVYMGVWKSLDDEWEGGF